MTTEAPPYFSFLWPDKEFYDKWVAQARSSNTFQDDLGMRQIIQALDLVREPKWLVEMLFCKPCVFPEVIEYRLDTMENLINSEKLFRLFQVATRQIDEFESIEDVESPRLKATHRATAFFQRAMLYCDIIIGLKDGLAKIRGEIQSKPLRDFNNLIVRLAESAAFSGLQEEVGKLRAQANKVQWVDLYFNCENEKITGLLVNSTPEKDERCLAADLIAAGQRISGLDTYKEMDFSQGAKFSPLEELLLQEALKVFPDYFAALNRFQERFQEYPMKHMKPLGPELKFYGGMIAIIRKLGEYGFSFCRPQVLAIDEKRAELSQVYDLSLALRLVKDNKNATAMIKNDYLSDETGRIFILTGPNQGGRQLSFVPLVLVAFYSKPAVSSRPKGPPLAR